MNKIFFIFTLAAMLGISSCGNAQNNETATEQQSHQLINKDVDVAEFDKLMTAGNGLLVDVRTDGEFAAGHLKGAKQIDINGSNFNEQVAKLDKDVPVYVYCRSGARSGRAAKMMKGMGFKEVYNLEGGILAWQRAGKSVER